MKLNNKIKYVCAAAITAAMMLQSFSVFAQWRQISDNQIIITDKIESGEEGKPVTINVLKSGVSTLSDKNDLIFHAQTKTGEGGNYEITFKITGESGNYIANINADGKMKSETISFEKFTQNSGGGTGGGGGGNSHKKPNNSSGIATIVTPKPIEELKIDIFDDLDSAEWAKDAIVSLAEKGILSGKGDKSFCPNENMTREEFAKVIVDAFLKDTTQADMVFDDVPNDAWYYSYVSKAFASGAINGVSETSFGTGKYITREDMVVILYRIIKDRLSYDGVEHVFADGEEISEYAKEAVQVFYQNSIINGMGDNCFVPKGNATRAQVAKIVASLL